MQKRDENLKINLQNYDQNETERLATIVASLSNETNEQEQKIDFLQTEIFYLRKELKKKDRENVKLQREIHKLKVRRHFVSSFPRHSRRFQSSKIFFFSIVMFS